MLSRKYVNVHACPIIRSSRSLFSSVPSFAISRSTFLPCPPACLSAPCETEIDRSSRESHEFTSCRDSELSRASGTRKRSIAHSFAPVVARRERWGERTRGEVARGSRIVPPYSIKGEFTWVRSSRVVHSEGGVDRQTMPHQNDRPW